MRRANARRAFLLVAALAAAWVLVVQVTGGLVIRVGDVRLLSARGIRNPAILACVAAAAWWLLAQHDRRAILTGDLQWMDRGARAAWRTFNQRLDRAASAVRGLAPYLPPLIAIAAVAAIVAVGMVEGAFVAGGSDSYGYVSQARLWAAGTPHVDEPLIRELDQIVSPEAAAPLGYTLTVGRDSIVPTYSPGYPLLMAAFDRLAGPPAVFWAVPVMAGLLVATTFFLGRAVGGAAVGASAAVLVATSPVVLFHVTTPPMSDVPGAAWWTLAWALLPGGSALAALGSGLAAGAAVLTRPNLVPLALIPLGALAWPMLRDRRLQAAPLRRAIAFVCGLVPGCAAVAAVNAMWYGSPFVSGYGSLADYYSWSHWAPNLARYPLWLVQTQTPLIALAVAAPFVMRRGGPSDGVDRPVLIGALGVFVLGVMLAYLFYNPFDSWIHLRFVMPAIPVLLIFLSAVIVAAARRLPGAAGGAAAAVAIALLAWNGFTESQARSVFISETERKYALVGRYVAGRLPQRAVLFAVQHSGSIRFYSGRKTLRWNYIDPIRLDQAVDRLRALDYEPYLVFESWEIPEFQERFKATRTLAALDWPPVAHLPLGNIRIFRAARPLEALPDVTETIPDP